MERTTDATGNGEPRGGHRLPLLAVIAADGLSRLGSRLTATAIPWFVLVTTGSEVRTGVTVFVSAVGVVLALLFGGAIVDRLSCRRASIIGDLTAAVAVALIPLLHHTVGLAFWQLLVLVLVATLLDTPAQVARYSALPELASHAGVRFERANALFEGVLTTAELVGPAVAGVLIVVFGASNVLWVDAATFGLSAALLATLVPAWLSPRPPSSASEGYRRQLFAALSFVRRDAVLFPLILFLASMNLVIGAVEAPLIPVYAHEVFASAIALGLMTAAGGLGSLGGNVLFGLIGHRLSRRAAFAGGFLVVPLALGVLALRPGLPATLATLAVLGLALSVTNLLEYTIYFERIPEGMRGRVLGITGAVSWATVPVGRLAVGVGLALFDLIPTLATLALLFLPLPLMMFAARAFRDLHPPVAPADKAA